MIKEVLKGHVSEEMAYIVDDYPYGFRLRCKIRYWLEHDPRRGTRLWSQTSNPKKPGLVWNKPKCSTYCFIAGAMYLDEKDYVQWSGLTHYEEARECRDWMLKFGEAIPEAVSLRVWEWIKKKEAYAKGGMAAVVEIELEKIKKEKDEKQIL
jgi:hypothetical protein